MCHLLIVQLKNHLNSFYAPYKIDQKKDRSKVVGFKIGQNFLVTKHGFQATQIQHYAGRKCFQTDNKLKFTIWTPCHLT